MAWKQTLKRIALLLMLLLVLPASVQAAQSSSAHYQVNEVFVGAGGELHSCSSGTVGYCAKESAGETAVGASCSTAYCAQAGFNTDRSPYIEFTVNNAHLDLGTLSPNSTKTAQTSFSVKAYLASGYSVINASDPPTNGSYLIHTDSTPQFSAVGTEQFGINLVANTSPTSFGSDPQYTPDTTFSFGQVNPNYSTTNKYKYTKGDQVAFSSSSSSYTTYTIAYIFNISNITPGGLYSMLHVLVATATY